MNILNLSLAREMTEYSHHFQNKKKKNLTKQATDSVHNSEPLKKKHERIEKNVEQFETAIKNQDVF